MNDSTEMCHNLLKVAPKSLWYQEIILWFQSPEILKFKIASTRNLFLTEFLYFFIFLPINHTLHGNYSFQKCAVKWFFIDFDPCVEFKNWKSYRVTCWIYVMFACSTIIPWVLSCNRFKLFLKLLLKFLSFSSFS